MAICQIANFSYFFISLYLHINNICINFAATANLISESIQHFH